jgi:hypothetical protein
MISILYPMSNKKDAKPIDEGLGIEHTLLRAAEGAIGPGQTFGNQDGNLRRCNPESLGQIGHRLINQPLRECVRGLRGLGWYDNHNWRRRRKGAGGEWRSCCRLCCSAANEEE